MVLLREDGAALLQHRDNKPGINHPDTWVPPGGHREQDEALEACARREFLEETGYGLGELRYLTRFLDAHEGISEPVWVTVFWSAYDGVQQPVCREGQALTFVSRGRAADLKVPSYLIRVWDLALAARNLEVRR